VRTPLALAVVTLAVTLAGCAGAQPSPGEVSGPTRTFAADNGEVVIPVKPQRVVATGYAVPVLIEAGAPLVGISEFKRSLPMMDEADRAAYDGLPKVAGETAATTNYEAIAAADPDLIVIGVPRPVLGDIDVERLTQLAPVVAIGPSVPSAWKTFSEKQADAAGASDGFDETRQAYLALVGQLREKYADVLSGVRWAHVGGYGEISGGTFQREFADSWGTNIAQDVGLRYEGQVRERTGGAGDVSENVSIEELSESVAGTDYISYTVQADGTPSAAVRFVLDSPLWKNLPQVKAGRTVALRYTEASTYAAATSTLDALDTQLAPLLEDR